MMERLVKRLYVKQHIYYIPVLHRVCLAFAADEAALFGFDHVVCGYEVVVVDYFGANEAAFEVGVDGSGGVLGVGAFANGPGAHFVFASRQEADEAEEGVRLADYFFQAGEAKAHALAEEGGVLWR